MSREELERIALTKYTNHYYIGSERITSVLGTLTQLGILCEQTGDPGQAMINRMDNKVDEAGTALKNAHTLLGKTLILKQPFHYNGQRLTCELTVYPDMYAAFWYHPDHLGSSSYITNLAGEITQHMEYLPFGETLVEEHLNSNNSPYKFNAKEYDAETGNYYYGARYYDPKFSIWLSVDPLAHMRESLSPYNYCSNNPILRIDPDGRLDGDYYNFDGTYLGSDGINDNKVYVVNSIDSETASKGLSSEQLLNIRDGEHLGSTNPTATLLPIKHSEFKAIAGTIYAEGTPWNLSFEEAAGIYSVMRNRADASGKSVYDIAGGGGIYGWSERDKINSSGAHQPSVRNAFRGTIEGLTNSKDYSGGGFYWHGSDFAKTTKGSHAHESYYKVGFNFTNPSHDIWDLGNTKSGNSSWIISINLLEQRDRQLL